MARAPIEETADALADAIWRMSEEYMDALAPDVPPGQAELADWDQYTILLETAKIVPWQRWRDPDMLADLRTLMRKLEPEREQEIELLGIMVERARKIAKATRFDPQKELA